MKDHSDCSASLRSARKFGWRTLVQAGQSSLGLSAIAPISVVAFVVMGLGACGSSSSSSDAAADAAKDSSPDSSVDLSTDHTVGTGGKGGS